MKDSINKYLWMLTMVLPLLWGCSSEEEDGVTENEEIRMPIDLYISDHVGESSRSIGDPGFSENLQRPLYLYAYFVEKLPNSVYFVDKLEEQLDPNLWQEVKDLPGLLRYTGNLSILLSNADILPTNTEATDETAESRVYAITSYSPLSMIKDDGSDGVDLKNQNSIVNLKLYHSKNPDVDLQNVYANPLGGDRTNGAVEKRGKFLYKSKVTCYHVAARIDIQWDINPEKQGTYKMQKIELTNLPKSGFFFKHTQNEDEGGKQIFTADIGNQWYGRHVFYAFDKNSVNCKYTLSNTTVVEKTYTDPKTGNHNNVYSSWYRINAKFGYPDSPTPPAP